MAGTAIRGGAGLLPVGPGIFLITLGCLLAFFVKLVDLESVSRAQRQEGYGDEKE